MRAGIEQKVQHSASNFAYAPDSVILHWYLPETHMDRASLEKLRAEALTLPDQERAQLARDLIESLDGPPDADAAEEWDAEIERRLGAIDAGTANLVDRVELQRRIKERLRDG
jgi:putative addiction module component (TIGR02574 family)